MQCIELGGVILISFNSCFLKFSDRIAMENCKGVVVISAIFNDHDKIRQPKGLGKQTPYSVCFFMFVDDVTLKGLQYHNLISTKPSTENSVGVWRIVKVEKEHLYENSAMNGVIPKYLVHRLFPNSKYSIWIDAKIQLVVDPFLLIHSLVVMEDVDMAISRHPFYVHTMEEAMATARWNKWCDVDGLKKQMETYCDNGLQPWTPEKPYPSGIDLVGSSFVIICCFLYFDYRNMLLSLSLLLFLDYFELFLLSEGSIKHNFYFFTSEVEIRFVYVLPSRNLVRLLQMLHTHQHSPILANLHCCYCYR